MKLKLALSVSAFWIVFASTVLLGREPAPVAIQVEPASIKIDVPRATQQLLVTARHEDGSLSDVTSRSQWKIEHPEIAQVTKDGLVRGLSDGQTQVEIRVVGLTKNLTIQIANSREAEPISFRRELMPVLSAAGCSDIRCHGAPSGKNGFRLSLWGHDPDLDFQQLTRDAIGRRTNPIAPDESLMMLKATGGIPHVGRQRFKANSEFAAIVRTWQAEGVEDVPSHGNLESLHVLPTSRVLHAPAQTQQLAVRATFGDGKSRDVTRLTTFSTTDATIATVSRTGLVEFKQQGEVAVICRFLGQMQPARLMHIAAPPFDYRWPEPPQNNYIDQHVFAKLRKLHIVPSNLSDDATFVRRVYLDLCGILPSPAETRSFIDNKNEDKRARLIDRLLQRPEYADLWTKKWLDVLRVSRDSINLAGAQAYQNWFRNHIENDRSMATIVQALLVSQGDSICDPETNFYCAAPMPRNVKDPIYFQKDLAESTAQLFLGIRLQCAQCHNHPYERWTQDDYLSLAAFFTQIKRTRLGKAGPSGRPERREISVSVDFAAPDLKSPSVAEPIKPHFPGESPISLAGPQDRRQVLADWLTRSDNPFFAKAVVNRIWFHLHGRGIVDPVDDFRDSNPASNEELLDALAADFVAGGFKLKPLIRTICNSRTYQLSAATNRFNQRDTRYFSHMLARPLSAEVLLDAICEVTDVPEVFEITKDYTIGAPDGTVKLPSGTRAVQLPVTDIATLINSSSNYILYELHPFLRKFGQPKRAQTCECDREQGFGRKQALELTVGPLLAAKLSNPKNRLGAMLKEDSESAVLEEIYLRALSRKPTDETAQAMLAHITSSTDRRQAWEDVLWTILNSQEFIYQH